MPLIMLSRDGVINKHSPDFIKSPEEWTPINNSLEAISKLTQNNYRVVVISNQPGIARRKLTIENLNAIHQKMVAQTAKLGGAIEAIFFCPHALRQDCDCHKPKPGLLLRLADRLHVSLKDVYFVGDSRCDIEAAQAAGARPALVKTGNGKALLAEGDLPAELPVFQHLAAFVDDLLGHVV